MNTLELPMDRTHDHAEVGLHRFSVHTDGAPIRCSAGKLERGDNVIMCASVVASIWLASLSNSHKKAQTHKMNYSTVYSLFMDRVKKYTADSVASKDVFYFRSRDRWRRNFQGDDLRRKLDFAAPLLSLGLKPVARFVF